jgi:hypothetical protein
MSPEMNTWLNLFFLIRGVDLIHFQSFSVVWNIGRPLRRMLPKWTMHECTHSATTHPSNNAHHSDYVPSRDRPMRTCDDMF